MSDPARAISVLKQARDLLSERLVQHLTENQEEILSDAIGLEHSGEINTLYEDLGARLLHVNTMLSQMPAPPPADFDEVPADLETATSTSTVSMPPNNPYIQSETATAGLTTVPESNEEVSTVAGSPAAPSPAAKPVNWETVVGNVQAHKADVGTALLADYFGIDATRAARCTQTFQERVNQTPELLAHAMRLGLELRSGSVNSSIMLLWECFGLQGTEAIAAMQSLKARLAIAS